MDRWKTDYLANTYLEGVRGAIPLANEQIEILLRIIRKFKPDFDSFLDLGCGDGILGRTLFSVRPNSKGIFLDYSEPMIEAAKSKCRNCSNQTSFIVQDFGKRNWMNPVSEYLPLDLVISGFSIHHQSDDNKKRIYRDIFEKILKPGGLFLNLDQVASLNPESEKLFDDYFLSHIENYNQNSGQGFPIETITKEYYEDKKVNIPAPVELQCNWLKDIGFHNVDCYFKVFELAVFGGVKPG